MTRTLSEILNGRDLTVVDSDTVDTATGRHRAGDFDAMEKGTAGGQVAKRFTEELATGVASTGERDKYGRTLSQIIGSDGESIAPEIVRAGVGSPSDARTDYEYRESIRSPIDRFGTQQELERSIIATRAKQAGDISFYRPPKFGADAQEDYRDDVQMEKRAIDRGWNNLKGSLDTFASVALGAVGLDEQSQRYADEALHHMVVAGVIPAEAKSLKAIHENGWKMDDVATFAYEKLFEEVPSLAIDAIMTTTGVLAGGAVARRAAMSAARKRLGDEALNRELAQRAVTSAVDKATKQGAKVGGAVAFGASTYPESVAQVQQELNANGIEGNDFATLALGGVVAGVQMAPEMLLAGRILKSAGAGKEMATLAGAAKALGTNTAIGVVGEGLAEAGASAVAKAGVKAYNSSYEVFSEDNMWEMAEAAAAGAAVGGTLGAGGSIAGSAYSKADELYQKKREELKTQEQESADIDHGAAETQAGSIDGEGLKLERDLLKEALNRRGTPGATNTTQVTTPGSLTEEDKNQTNKEFAPRIVRFSKLTPEEEKAALQAKAAREQAAQAAQAVETMDQATETTGQATETTAQAPMVTEQDPIKENVVEKTGGTGLGTTTLSDIIAQTDQDPVVTHQASAEVETDGISDDQYSAPSLDDILSEPAETPEADKKKVVEETTDAAAEAYVAKALESDDDVSMPRQKREYGFGLLNSAKEYGQKAGDVYNKLKAYLALTGHELSDQLDPFSPEFTNVMEQAARKAKAVRAKYVKGTKDELKNHPDYLSRSQIDQMMDEAAIKRMKKGTELAPLVRTVSKWMTNLPSGEVAAKLYNALRDTFPAKLDADPKKGMNQLAKRIENGSRLTAQQEAALQAMANDLYISTQKYRDNSPKGRERDAPITIDKTVAAQNAPSKNTYVHDTERAEEVAAIVKHKRDKARVKTISKKQLLHLRSDLGVNQPQLRALYENTDDATLQSFYTTAVGFEESSFAHEGAQVQEQKHVDRDTGETLTRDDALHGVTVTSASGKEQGAVTDIIDGAPSIEKTVDMVRSYKRNRVARMAAIAEKVLTGEVSDDVKTFVDKYLTAVGYNDFFIAKTALARKMYIVANRMVSDYDLINTGPDQDDAYTNERLDFAMYTADNLIRWYAAEFNNGFFGPQLEKFAKALTDRIIASLARDGIDVDDTHPLRSLPMIATMPREGESGLSTTTPSKNVPRPNAKSMGFRQRRVIDNQSLPKFGYIVSTPQLSGPLGDGNFVEFIAALSRLELIPVDNRFAEYMMDSVDFNRVSHLTSLLGSVFGTKYAYPHTNIRTDGGIIRVEAHSRGAIQRWGGTEKVVGPDELKDDPDNPKFTPPDDESIIVEVRPHTYGPYMEEEPAHKAKFHVLGHVLHVLAESDITGSIFSHIFDVVNDSVTALNTIDPRTTNAVFSTALVVPDNTIVYRKDDIIYTWGEVRRKVAERHQNAALMLNEDGEHQIELQNKKVEAMKTLELFLEEMFSDYVDEDFTSTELGLTTINAMGGRTEEKAQNHFLNIRRTIANFARAVYGFKDSHIDNPDSDVDAREAAYRQSGDIMAFTHKVDNPALHRFIAEVDAYREEKENERNDAKEAGDQAYKDYAKTSSILNLDYLKQMLHVKYFGQVYPQLKADGTTVDIPLGDIKYNEIVRLLDQVKYARMRLKELDVFETGSSRMDNLSRVLDLISYTVSNEGGFGIGTTDDSRITESTIVEPAESFAKLKKAAERREADRSADEILAEQITNVITRAKRGLAILKRGFHDARILSTLSDRTAELRALLRDYPDAVWAEDDIKYLLDTLKNLGFKEDSPTFIEISGELEEASARLNEIRSSMATGYESAKGLDLLDHKTKAVLDRLDELSDKVKQLNRRAAIARMSPKDNIERTANGDEVKSMQWTITSPEVVDSQAQLPPNDLIPEPITMSSADIRNSLESLYQEMVKSVEGLRLREAREAANDREQSIADRERFEAKLKIDMERAAKARTFVGPMPDKKQDKVTYRIDSAGNRVEITDEHKVGRNQLLGLSRYGLDTKGRRIYGKTHRNPNKKARDMGQKPNRELTEKRIAEFNRNMNAEELLRTMAVSMVRLFRLPKGFSIDVHFEANAEPSGRPGPTPNSYEVYLPTLAHDGDAFLRAAFWLAHEVAHLVVRDGIEGLTPEQMLLVDKAYDQAFPDAGRRQIDPVEFMADQVALFLLDDALNVAREDKDYNNNERGFFDIVKLIARRIYDGLSGMADKLTELFPNRNLRKSALMADVIRSLRINNIAQPGEYNFTGKPKKPVELVKKVWNASLDNKISNIVKPIARRLQNIDRALARMFFTPPGAKRAGSTIGLMDAMIHRRKEFVNRINALYPEHHAFKKDYDKFLETGDASPRLRASFEFMSKALDKVRPNGYKFDGVPVMFSENDIKTRTTEFRNILLGDNPTAEHTANVDEFISSFDYSNTVYDELNIKPSNPFGKASIFNKLIAGNAKLVPKLRRSGFIPHADVHTLNHFAGGMAARIEFERLFGGEEAADKYGIVKTWNPSKKLAERLSAIKDPNQRQEAVRAIHSMLGFDGHKIHPSFRSFNDWAVSLTSLAILPFSGFAAVTDLVMPLIRNRTWSDAVGGMARATALMATNPKRAKEIMRAYSLASNSLHDTVWGQMAADNLFLSRAPGVISTVLFKLNGLDMITKMSRNLASVLAVDAIITHAKRKGPESSRFLNELSISREQAMALADFMAKNNTVPVYHPDASDAHNQLAEAVSRAVTVFSNESVVQPNKGQLPALMNDPKYRIFTLLKPFLYAFGSVVYGGSYREMRTRFMNHTDLGSALVASPLAISPIFLAFALMLPMAAMGLELREILRDALGDTDKYTTRLDNLSDSEYVMRIFTRAGGGAFLEIPLQVYEGWERGYGDVKEAAIGAGLVAAGPVVSTAATMGMDFKKYLDGQRDGIRFGVWPEIPLP